MVTCSLIHSPAQDGGNRGRTCPAGSSSKVLEAPPPVWKAPISAQAAAHKWNNNWDQILAHES